MKKGRHRRFEEARALKRSTEVIAEPCPECGADPEDDHASWCMFEEDEEDEFGNGLGRYDAGAAESGPNGSSPADHVDHADGAAG